MDHIDLSGTWLAHLGEHDLHQRFFEPGFDDAGWSKVTVPGHWRSAPEFAESDGPILYRHRFEAPPLEPGRRRFLVLDGVFYFADTWLDGAYLGASEGYFLPHGHEVTELMAGVSGDTADDVTDGGAGSGAGGAHVVAVEVGCPRQHDRKAKRLITGVFSHWDCFDSRWNPGGLWRPVHLVETGTVRIARLRVVCAEATEERGRLRLDMTLDAPSGADGPIAVALRARLAGPGVAVETERTERLAAGSNHLEWTLDVDRPPLWWPRRLGEQPLCDLDVEVRVAGGDETAGEASDRRHVRTAFREVRLDDWIVHVNGERLYTMGANHPPTRMELAEATPGELRRDVELALDANLDMLRIHGHVTRPELYEAADELGLLLWQDFPLQWGYARGLRKEAARQAAGMVDLLGHHPSVALWCAHNEPLAVDIPTGEAPSPGTIARVGASMFAPTWNKSVLDRSVRRAIERADGSRPVDPHSGIVPGPLSGGTDSHLYFGWYFGHLADLGPALKAWPRLARFVSEFGAQAVPDGADFLDVGAWPDLDWERLLERHCLQKLYFDRHVPPDEYADLASWRQATQAYQAALLQLQVEDLRRLKYRPGGGFLQFCFADALPAVTWSVLDHQRAPKPGFEALRDACRPVLPMLDPRSGAVHVVSERRDALEGAEIEASAGSVRRRWSGDVDADGVTFVGSLDGPVEADEATVTLRHPALGDGDGGDGGEVVNRYGPTLLRAVRTRLGP